MILRKIKIILALAAVLQVSMYSTINAQGQEHKNFLLKKVGNLYILNVGANDGVKNHTVYNLYFEKDKRLPFLRIKFKTEREYFGAVQVTQIFPEYCVVRIISKVMEKEPEGNKIILVSKGLPDEIMRRLQSISAGSPLKQTVFEEEPVVKTIVPEFKDESYKPFSVGINYFREYDGIAKPVTNNLIDELNKKIYSGNGIFTPSFTSNGGINLTVSKMLASFLTVEGGLAFIKQKSILKSVLNPETEIPEGLVSVKRWDFDMNTTIINWSLTFQFSQFSKAVSFFTGRQLERRYVPRIGIGVDYASAETTMKQNVLIGKLTGNQELAPFDKQSLGGFWGLHAVAGLDYYLQAVKFYAEINYNTWFSDKYNADFPFRIGASVFF